MLTLLSKHIKNITIYYQLPCHHPGQVTTIFSLDYCETWACFCIYPIIAKVHFEIKMLSWPYFLSPKITADGDCSYEIKRHLLLGRKAMTNLDSILKSRDIAFPTKFCPFITMVFLIVMYEYDSWTIKKAERWRMGTFELWCWSWDSLEQQGDKTSQS